MQVTRLKQMTSQSQSSNEINNHLFGSTSHPKLFSWGSLPVGNQRANKLNFFRLNVPFLKRPAGSREFNSPPGHTALETPDTNPPFAQSTRRAVSSLATNRRSYIALPKLMILDGRDFLQRVHGHYSSLVPTKVGKRD